VEVFGFKKTFKKFEIIIGWGGYSGLEGKDWGLYRDVYVMIKLSAQL